MTAFLFANNASTTLAAPISAVATTLTLAAGSGAKFPTPATGQSFTLTLKDSATGENTEIMYCTSRTADVCTVVRGREGTTAQTWTTGDFANNTLTAGVAAAFLQDSGSFGTMADQDADDVAITGGSINVTTLEVGGVAVATNPATSKGDILVADASGVLHRLAVGADGQALTARSTATLGVDWEADGGGGSALAWVILGGDTDADMATAVAAINASSIGGVLYIPPMTATLANAYTFTKPVSIFGCGCANENMTGALSNLITTSGTNNFFEFTVNPWQVRDVHIGNSFGTPTAGAGIYGQQGSGHRLQNVTVDGFWNDIQIDNAAEWYWLNVVCFGPVNYGAQINDIASPDGGDQGIVNCQFISHNHNAVAGVRYETGGGLRMTNAKFNQRGSATFTYGIDVEITGNTADFLLSNSSIENTSVSAIRMRNSGGGKLNNLSIVGVQCQNNGSGSPFDIQATSAGIFDRLIIDACSFTISSASVAAINLANIDNVAIGVCVYLGYTQLLTVSGVTNFRNVNARQGTAALATSGAIPVDCTNAENFNCSLAGNGTLGLPTNCASGTMGSIRVHGNGHTLAFASGWKFPGGVAPTISAGNFDILSFQYDGFDGTFALVAVQNFS